MNPYHCSDLSETQDSEYFSEIMNTENISTCNPKKQYKGKNTKYIILKSVMIQHNSEHLTVYTLICKLLNRKVGTVMNTLTSLSARLGSTTLAKGMLTGSLLGWTVLRGILIGRLVMLLSP